jgi:hypothetical protein
MWCFYIVYNVSQSNPSPLSLPVIPLPTVFECWTISTFKHIHSLALSFHPPTGIHSQMDCFTFLSLVFGSIFHMWQRTCYLTFQVWLILLSVMTEKFQNYKEFEVIQNTKILFMGSWIVSILLYWLFFFLFVCTRVCSPTYLKINFRHHDMSQQVLQEPRDPI